MPKSAGQQHTERPMSGDMRRDAERYEGRVGVSEGKIQLARQVNRPMLTTERAVPRGQSTKGHDLRPECGNY